MCHNSCTVDRVLGVAPVVGFSVMNNMKLILEVDLVIKIPSKPNRMHYHSVTTLVNIWAGILDV